MYGSFRAAAEKDMYRAYVGDKYQKMFERLNEIIPIIHWGRLPLFNKYLIYNREKDPEFEMMEFYEHPDCLNALLKEVKNQEPPKETYHIYGNHEKQICTSCCIFFL